MISQTHKRFKGQKNYLNKPPIQACVKHFLSQLSIQFCPHMKQESAINTFPSIQLFNHSTIQLFKHSTILLELINIRRLHVI